MSDIMFSVEEVLTFEILDNGILWACVVVGCRKVRRGAERLFDCKPVTFVCPSLCLYVRIFQT
jgi:hypothetical protein